MTGHHGYIGSVMFAHLREAGHDVDGLDTFLYLGCNFGDRPEEPEADSPSVDVRNVEADSLSGYDAVIHLAALSNDSLGNLDPELTYEVNHRASTRLARMAREAGVQRFLFASSCSLYGRAGTRMLDESADFNPVTPYGESKVRTEADLSALAGENFSPTCMRNATVYGVSPRLRTDIVVNNLVGLAHVTGEILLTSDGSPWRPLVHVEDVCRAFRAVLEAPREAVHDEAFNVGRSDENYQIRQVAEIVAEALPGTEIALSDDASPDPRDYRVDCSKLEASFPAHRPRWTVPEGVEELRDAFREHGLSADDLRHRYVRLERIDRLQDEGLLDDQLRWSDTSPNGAPNPSSDVSRRTSVSSIRS